MVTRHLKYILVTFTLILSTIGFQIDSLGLSSGDVSFTLKTDDSGLLDQDVIIDSNKCPAEGPTAIYISGNVTNTSGGTLSDVTVQLANISAQFSLGGGQVDTISLGTMSAGDSQLVAWLVEYPCTDGFTGSADVIISDSNPGTDISTVNLTVREARSANAGGNVITSVLGPGAVVGQIINMDTRYDFGNIDIGNEFFLQPSGSAAFDAGCFQLVGTEVIGSNVTAIPIGVIDDLHFISSVKQSGNNYNATIRYFFRYLCAGASTVARPYSAQTSGANNLKYTGNYDGSGAVTMSFPGATNPFVITKSVTPNDFFNSTGGTVTFNVTITNESIHDSYIDNISDILPSGVVYTGLAATSDITVAISNSTPANGATGTIEFEGNMGSSYEILAGESLNLIYTATIPDTVGDYTNSAEGSIGFASTGTTTATVSVSSGNRLSATKNVDVYDPAMSGVYAVPNEEVVYTITGANNGSTVIDDGSIVIVDEIPDEIIFYNGDFNNNPGDGITIVNFVDNGSGLTCCTNAHIEFSSTASGPPVWGYIPSTGYDENVHFIRVTPENAMNGNDPNVSEFSVQFRARIK